MVTDIINAFGFFMRRTVTKEGPEAWWHNRGQGLEIGAEDEFERPSIQAIARDLFQKLRYFKGIPCRVCGKDGYTLDGTIKRFHASCKFCRANRRKSGLTASQALEYLDTPTNRKILAAFEEQPVIRRAAKTRIPPVIEEVEEVVLSYCGLQSWIFLLTVSFHGHS